MKSSHLGRAQGRGRSAATRKVEHGDRKEEGKKEGRGNGRNHKKEEEPHAIE